MKKFELMFLLSIVFISLLSSSSLFARYNNAISINPFDFIFDKSINFTYEQKTSANNSFTILASLLSQHKYWQGFGVGASYRWYFDFANQRKAPIQNFSIGPFMMLRFVSWHGPKKDDYHSGSYFLFGGEFAHKWVFDGFLVEPILRLGFGVNDVKGYSYPGWGLGVNLGYAW